MKGIMEENITIQKEVKIPGKVVSYFERMIDSEMKKIFKNSQFQHSLIVVLFEEEDLPKYCIPMPRNPEPEINILLNEDFSKIYFSTLKKNPSIEDGAILIQIDCTPPILRGFSYRVFPPHSNLPRKKNLGSGYNSSLDFSNVSRVKCVYFANTTGVKKFIKGKEIKLC